MSPLRARALKFDTIGITMSPLIASSVAVASQSWPWTAWGMASMLGLRFETVQPCTTSPLAISP